MVLNPPSTTTHVPLGPHRPTTTGYYWAGVLQMNLIEIMILITENKRRVATTGYPAAPDPTLLDIVFVDVVIPLDVV